MCLRTWTKINEHEILTRAAAISFYALAALVPFLAMVIALREIHGNNLILTLPTELRL